ncbi:Vacuolar protein sorting/targeting protein 10 [Thelohanellus kitauei]|uniref:Vacuolar protein sorting/targeting protein 10 n=1 Tax=Thelohanellus kitauei TaxID=669202 RepID=A0A0C2JAQ0_THEKT|nr:Vacuolar protein sorting/targeting protein 10 [Thelohanellus kitauei]
MACYYHVKNENMEHNFYIGEGNTGLLYLNFPSNKNEGWTRRSTDDGRFWYDMKFIKPGTSEELYRPVHFDFAYHDYLSVSRHFLWIDIQYEKFNNYLQPFITFDMGYSWKAIPRTNSKAIMLTDGTVVMSVDQDSRGINYSFDYADTWLRLDQFSTEQTVFFVGRLSNTDQRALIVSRASITNMLTFTYLDFSNVIYEVCQKQHYIQQPIPGSRKNCYPGKKLVVSIRGPRVRCLDKRGSSDIRIKNPCPCSSDDFPCTFNYNSFGDICILDTLSGITEEPKKCPHGSQVSTFRFGYVKLVDSSCKLDKWYLYIKKNARKMCTQNEWTNFILLHAPKKIYMLQIMPNGGHSGLKRPPDIDFGPHIDVAKQVAIDYPRKLIYYLGGTISQ